MTFGVKKWGVLLGLLLVVVLQPVTAQELSSDDRLAGLCKVWGFLKYYADDVVTGKIDWDQVLVDAIPRVKAAESKDAFNHEMLMLVRCAGYRGPSGTPGATPTSTCMADFSWMEDDALFFPVTSALLKGVKTSRAATNSAYYYYFPEFADGNLDFSNELPYIDMTNVTEEYRLLALFRYWNIIHYFYPYQDIMGEDWNQLLLEYIPRLRDEVASDTDYCLLIREFTARIHDSHAYLSSALLESWWGLYVPGLYVSWIEGQTVVTQVFPGLLQGVDVAVGDVITHIRGQLVGELRRQLSKYIGASNESRLQYNLSTNILRSKDQTLEVTILRDGSSRVISLPCTTMANVINASNAVAPTEVYKILPGNIGYLHVGRLPRGQGAQAMNALMGTRAIVFDVRNYPQGTIYEICNFLYPEAKEFSLFSYPDVVFPGYFKKDTILSAGPTSPNPDYYKGKVIILANESSQSHAEFTCMALQGAPGATLIGSQTSGADGNVSKVTFPGNMFTYFTGLGVFYPDGRPTQRVGIVPNIEIRPTIAGIRAGRDEVLERALEFIETGR